MCVFLPKIHCKLNPIERVWCHAKKHVKTKNIGSRSISHSCWQVIVKFLILSKCMKVHIGMDILKVLLKSIDHIDEFTGKTVQVIIPSLINCYTVVYCTILHSPIIILKYIEYCNIRRN